MGLKKHAQYGWYVLRHKWHVFRACMILHVPLHQAVLHDWSKLLPGEWIPYAENFYGKGQSDDPAIKRVAREAFDYAWLAHQHASPHHWQHFVLREDSGKTKVMRMPSRFVREMVADWAGAGRVWGRSFSKTHEWYEKQEHLMLHPETRREVEQLLTILREHLNNG